MLSQTVPTIRDTPGASIKTLLKALKTFPYRAVHALDIVDPIERAEFGAIVRERGLWLDFCVSRALGNDKLSPASADPSNRRRAVDMVCEMIVRGVEQGARYVSLSSGTGHRDARDRPDAIGRLAESLAKIYATIRAAATPGSPELGLLIEPMDVELDKRGTLGYAPEAIELVRALGAPDADVRLICDTAHLSLNGETPDSIVHAAELVATVHLCNCCVDPGNELFGDKHIRPGEPGVFDLDAFRRIVEEIEPVFAKDGPVIPVFIEYRNHGDPDEHLSYLAESFARVLVPR